MEEIADRVIDIVAEQLGLAPEEIQPEASFSSDLGVDTLDMVELIMAFEEEFDMEISDEDAESLSRVQDAVDFVSARLQ